MRKLVVLLVLAICGLLVILGGCAPRVHFPPETAKTDQVFDTTYHNDSSEPIALECVKRGSINLRESWHVIYPGEFYIMTSRGGWETNCRIRYWLPEANDFVGETMIDLPFRHNSLLSREVRISDLTLDRRKKQKIKIENKAEPMKIWDNWGNTHYLKTDQEIIYEVPSGRIKLSIIPIRLDGKPHVIPWELKYVITNRLDCWHNDNGTYVRLGKCFEITHFPRENEPGFWR